MDTEESNHFADAEDRESLIFQLAGAASMCWEYIDKAGIFQSDKAKEFCDDALLRLKELDNLQSDKSPQDIDTYPENIGPGDIIDIGPGFTNGEVIFQHVSTFTKVDQHINHIITVANWLLDKEQ